MKFSEKRLAIIKKTLAKKGKSYGDARDMMTKIATAWENYHAIRHDATDVAMMMVQLKQCRADYLVKELERTLGNLTIEEEAGYCITFTYKKYTRSIYIDDTRDLYVMFDALCLYHTQEHAMLKDLVDSLLDRDCYLYLADQFKEV